MSLEVSQKGREGNTRAGRPVLLLFTDGRANVGLGQGEIEAEISHFSRLLKKAGVQTIVLDTTRPGNWTGAGEKLARLMKADYLALPQASSRRELTRVINRLRERL